MKIWNILAMMSGTSMDGLDCGLFELSLQKDYTISWNILDFKTIACEENL